MLRVLEEFDGGAVDLEKIKPDVKQAILWTREAWDVGVEPKTIVNCWRKTGILPSEDVEVVEQSSGDKLGYDFRIGSSAHRVCSKCCT